MINEHNLVQDIFNRIAPVYDQLNDGLSLGQHWVWKKMAVGWSGSKPGDTALDLCCGSGDLALLLAQQVGQSGQVFGVDFSHCQLEIAKHRPRPFTIPTAAITWVEADVLALPFDNNSFDSATMGYGLRNVTDIPRSLQELYRVLKPRATAAILDFHRPESVLLRTFQQWYLDQIVVPAAERWGFKEEYAYINPSLEKFPRGNEQVRLAQEAGFSHATHYPIANGMMGVLVITKSD